MSPSPEADPLYLDQIVEIGERVVHDLQGVKETEFNSNRLLSDATAYRLGAIGEVTGKLSSEFKKRHPAIQWRNIIKLRNIVAHHYDRINAGIIWAIASHDLPVLVAACRAELARIDGD